METINETLKNLDVIISWWIVLLTLAAGEITKLLWPVPEGTTPKITKAWRIFIVAICITAIMKFLRKTPYEVWIISVGISYVIHALFAKPIIEAIGRLIEKWNK